MADAHSSRIKLIASFIPNNEPFFREADFPRHDFAQSDEATSTARQADDLLTAQTQVLETLSKETSLAEMLEVFAKTIERQSDGMLCSILLLERNTLRHGAAPSLPAGYNAAVDGLAIGPAVGSCGTAAFTKKQVIVSDIATDPLWADFRDFALGHGLRACWSTPILSAEGAVLGTFALYYRTPREPTEHDRRLMEIWTHLAALGIGRKQAEEALRAEQQLLLHLFKTLEYERQLAAYELHDGIAQFAAGAVMHLESFLCTLDDAQRPVQLDLVDHLLRKTLQESRRMINGLRPPILDESGVVAAIEHLIQDQPTDGTRIIFEHQIEHPRLARELETAIFRIAQEALSNAKKHSGSTKIKVVLQDHGDRIQLAVRDWGKGFAPGRVSIGRHGLRGICERVRLLGGTVVIDSQLGKGTSISVDLPVLERPSGA